MTGDAQRFRRAAHVVAAEFGVPPAAVWQRPPGRGQIERRRLRQVAVYLAAVACEVPKQRLARVAGLARQTVQSTLRQVEDRRDDPDFDARVQRLEERLLEDVA